MKIFTKKTCLLCICSLLTIQLLAQVEQVGKVISYRKIPGGITGKTTNTIFDIHAYNDNIIRVRVSKKKAFDNFSYALTNNEIPAFKLSVADSINFILLKTKAITVVVEKAPSFRVIFK